MTESTSKDNAAEEKPSGDMIEFVGTPPFGTEFHSTHTISNQHMKHYHNVELGQKEAVWQKGPDGRFLVPISDLNPDAVKIILGDPQFKRVTR